MFTTDRLVLRAFMDSDLPALLGMENDLQVQTGFTHDAIVPKGQKHAEKIMIYIYTAVFFAVIVDKETGALIGHCSYTCPTGPKNRDAVLAIALTPSQWKKGYGSEAAKFLIHYAFNSLGMHRISLAVFAYNTAAIALYKKLGFVQEGCRRQCNFVDGEWTDILAFGLLESEFWAANPKAVAVEAQ